MSIVKLFSKKITVSVIITTIMLSIIFNNIIIYFVKDFNNYAIKINQEKISPNMVQFLYKLNKKFNHTKKENNLNKLKYNIQKKRLEKKTLFQIIYNALIQQYIKKIHFHFIKKNIKQKIFSSKFFQEDKKFNLDKYLNFINFLGLTNSQYISALQNKESAKCLKFLLLKSEIFLDKYLYETTKKNIEQRNIQIGYFSSPLTSLEKIIKFKNIKNYYTLNKKNFFYPKRIKLRIFCFKNIKPIQQKYYKKNNLDKIESYINIEKCEKKYTIIKSKNIKYAQSLFHNIQHENRHHQNIKKNLLKIEGAYQIQETKWMDETHTPNFIKKLNLHKKGDVSPIIMHHKKFFMIQLKDKKKYCKNKTLQKKKRNAIFCNDKNTKNVKSIKNISNFLKENNFHSLINKKNLSVQYINTNWIAQNKKLNFRSTHPLMYFIQKNFFGFRNIKNKSSIKIFLSKDKKLYVLQEISYQPKKIKKLKHVYQDIKNILQKKKLYMKNSTLIKDFLSSKKNTLNSFTKKNKLYFQPTKTIQFNKNTKNYIKKIAFQLPIPKKNKFIYTIIHRKNNLDNLLILKNVFYKKINNNQKIELINKTKNQYRDLIFSIMLKNIYKIANIKYQEKY